jgi:hypothetical protein
MRFLMLDNPRRPKGVGIIFAYFTSRDFLCILF